jgi:filamentous hemagglutinin family protein
MNKHRHRIVFNRTRGLFMAVAECAGTHQGGQTAQASRCSAAAPLPSSRFKALTISLMMAWGAVIVLSGSSAHAQIVSDHSAPSNQQPMVQNAANGVTLVNIQTPSAAGVSRNTYSQFDVQRPGVILNNSSGNVQTQLGGWVQGNPWLAGGSARVILNEVTSGSPSQLKGYMEVAGQRAQVVVANPAGISCDGCGFINANRGTLTTGTAIFNNGNLQGYRVTGGTIEVNGAGLQGQTTDYTDLISRAVKVNAGIWANQLLVTTGVNQVSADQSVITPLGAAQATDAAPAFAIDTSQLGGMYAGKIVLVGTEGGLGMRNAGQINASAGSLTLTNDGQLLNTGLLNGQDTTVRVTSLNNLGGGRIYGDRLAVTADTLTQTSQGSGNDTQSPVIAARERLDIGVGTLLNQTGGLIFSLGDLSIGGSLTPQPDGSLSATGRAQRVENHSARIEAMGSLSLSSQFLGNYNDSFSLTSLQQISSTYVVDYALTQGHDEGNNLDPATLLKRFTPSEVYIGWDAQGNKLCEVDCMRVIATGEISDAFNKFEYTRTISETQVATTAPGLISAAQDMNLDVGHGVNDKSRIMAGQTLNVTGGQLDNVGAQGQRQTKEQGQVTSSWRHQVSGEDHSDTSTGPYTPADQTQTITQSVGQQASNSAQARQGSGTTLPTRGMFVVNPAQGSGPVIEGDPRFTNQRQWLSSDYMLQQMSIDPATVQKRLGDGFYEQALVRDQVAQLTGKRFLAGYSSDEAQYRALLDNGVTVARALNLRPGVVLSAEQAAHLTSDLVLLEATTVTLPSGQTLQVLQPRVYLMPRAGDLQANGDLMAAQNLNVHVSGDVINSGGMGARQVLSINAANIRNIGGSMAAQDTRLNAAQDIDVQGGSLQAQRSLSLTAGQDVKVASTTASSANAQASATYIDRVADLHVSDAAGQLLIQAARDARLQAAQLNNEGAGGTTAIQAGRDIQVGTVRTQQSQTMTWDARNHRTEASSQDVGSTIAAKGDIHFQAGRDLAFEAALAQSEQGSLDARAAGNVDIKAGQASQSVDEAHFHRSSGFMSSKSTATRDVVSQTQAQASVLSAANVNMQAGQNLTVQGSAISGTQGNTTLQAGQDVKIMSAQDSLVASSDRQDKKSGLSTSLQSGVSVGRSSASQTQQTSRTSQVTSSVSGQNVNITAQRDATVQASTVLADQDISVQAGRNLDVTAADNTQQTTSSASSHGTKVSLIGGISPNQTLYGRQNSQQSGQDIQVSQSTSVLSANGGSLTLTAGADSQYRGTKQGNMNTQGADLLAGKTVQVEGNSVTLDTAVTASSRGSTQAKQSSTTLGAQLSGTVGSRITSAWTMAEASAHTDNERLARAERLKATYDAYKLSQGVNELVSAGGKQNATDTSSGSAFGVSVSLGNSSSQQQSSYASNQVRGTNAQAQTINVKSRDADITAVGAKLQADDITLDAAQNLNLMAAENTASQQSSNKGHNAGVGVTVGFGQQNGISFQIGVGGNRGKANGSETTYDNTLVTAAKQLNIKSGSDTTLQGAQVAGNTVKADVGGKLNIITLQDQSSSESKQESYGANISLCIPPICYGNVVTGSVNMAQSGFNHNYQSAVGQSGIAAGQGGFDIKVQGDTSLTGAAITSTADKSKNSLQTASLSYKDLENKQNTDSYSRSVGLAYNGGSAGSTLAANGASNLLGNIAGQQGLPKEGSDRSSTLSVISPANITLTGTGNAQKDQASQQAASTLTSRDAKTANGALTNTLTLQQAADAQKDIQHAQENAQAGQIVGSVAFNVAGDIAAKQGWPDGSVQKIVLHGLAGLIQATAGGQNGAVGALAAMGNEALTKQINDYISKSVPITDGMTPAQVSQAQQARKELAEASASLLGATTVALAGGVTGKGSAQDVQLGGQVALNADRFNRQLHPKEIDWIKQNAKRFAQQQGISPDAAEQRLAQQAFREVQFGAPGNLDLAAQQFLKINTQGVLLPGDPTIPGQTVGYMFRADPIQKANPMMYATQVVADPAALAFYAKNGITQPTAPQLQQAASKDASARSNLRTATMGAAGAAIAATVPPALSWCLSNPVACNRIAITGGEIAAGDAIGPTGLGVAGLAAVKAVKSAEEVNAAMAAKGWSPAWSPATPVINGVIPTGTKVTMIVDKITADAINEAVAKGDFSKVRLGGWATFDNVSSTAIDLRQKAAVTGEFKPSANGPFFAVELEVQKPLESNIGFAGAQINKEKLPDGTLINLETVLRGGATQAEFLIPATERIQYLKPTSIAIQLGH